MDLTPQCRLFRPQRLAAGHHLRANRLTLGKISATKKATASLSPLVPVTATAPPRLATPFAFLLQPILSFRCPRANEFLAQPGVELGEHGNVRANETAYQANQLKFFVAGDTRRRQLLVV